MSWLYLLFAAGLEVGFTTTLRLIHQAPRTPWELHLLFIGLIVGSFHFLQIALKTIPLGTAYAVWTGLGAAGTVIVGVLFFNERADFIRLALIGLVVAAAAGLKLTEHPG